MSFRVELWRGDELVHDATRDSLDHANATVDDISDQAHKGIHGVGEFEIRVGLMAVTGIIEKYVDTYPIFSVPEKNGETAS